MTQAEKQRELLQEAVREVLQEELIKFMKPFLNEVTKIVKSNKQVLTETRQQPRRVNSNPYEQQPINNSSAIEPLNLDSHSLFEGFFNAEPMGRAGLNNYSFND